VSGYLFRQRRFEMALVHLTKISGNNVAIPVDQILYIEEVITCREIHLDTAFPQTVNVKEAYDEISIRYERAERIDVQD
jgi:hypothetical protein